MKKPALIPIFVAGLLLSASSCFAQFFKIDTIFYSPSLKEYRKASIYLPHNYYQEHDCYYPAAYFLHGWGGNQNALDDKQMLMSILLNSGQIDPMIIVCADNSCQPFGTGVYVNSVITGNFEDFTIDDLIPFVDENFRTIPEKNARALFGHSLGAYGAFRLGILYKDMFRVISAHAAPANYDLWMPAVRTMLMFENEGPPYYYDFYDNTGLNENQTAGFSNFFTKVMFLASSGFSPDPNSSQTYINPPIVQYPFNQYCQLIDSVYDKWHNFNIPLLISTLSPSDSLSIIYGCGLYDETLAYFPNFALQDTLTKYGISYKFVSHKANHQMPDSYFTESLMFIDSLLTDYSIYTHTQHTGTSGQFVETYPNPFGNKLNVNLNLREQTSICLSLHDITGKQEIELFEGMTDGFTQKMSFDTRHLEPGIYLLKLQTPNHSETLKLIHGL
ncbi:MAG TPA: alpha/beta hydrolase-fold protein [Lentimicrobium sp.]|jgi:S-formylglutathione hydrolase FrmB|nr:alpha/beta hydrolase-fold protein [Lentimicrobium sp.]